MPDEKKIIVDEDWKSRVAAEKEEAERKQAGAAAGADPALAASASAQQHGQPSPLPAASFELLLTTLVTEAMIGLGQLPHPITQQLHPDPAQARYAIDMLEVLAEKTKGNLTPNEDRFLGDILHQLRMAFVAVSAQPTPTMPAK